MNLVTPHNSEASEIVIEQGISDVKILQTTMNIGLATMLVVSVFYLILLNNWSTQGFGVEELKSDRIELIKELENIEMKAVMPLTVVSLGQSKVVQAMEDIKTSEKTFYYREKFYHGSIPQNIGG